MPSLPTLGVFAGASVLLLLVPGPAVLYILARSATQGRRAGLVSVAGVHTGTLVHVAAAAAGLSAVLVASATAFAVVKLVGAAYLIWLGVRTLLEHRRRPAPGDAALASAAPRRLRRIYADAVVVNVLNPKTAVFFLAFVPQFIDPAAGNATTQLLVLSALFIALGLVSDSAYAMAGAWAGQRLTRAPRASRRAHLVAGGAYLGLGVATAAAGGGGGKA